MFADKVKIARKEYETFENENIIKPLRKFIDFYLNENHDKFVESLSRSSKHYVSLKKTKPKVNTINDVTYVSFSHIGEEYKVFNYSYTSKEIGSLFHDSVMIRIFPTEMLNACKIFFSGMHVETKFFDKFQSTSIVVSDSVAQAGNPKTE